MSPVAISAEEAEAELRAAGFEPLGPWPGSVGRSWSARCITCGVPRKIYLKNIRSGQRCKHQQSAEGDLMTPAAIARLAALSRAYREAQQEINLAIAQEMGRLTDPDWRAYVGERFGLKPEELPRYQPAEIKRLHRGFIHRAGLQSTEEVLAEVLREIRTGRLKPGDQFPPRTRFTEWYRCDKKTHAEVVTWLKERGVIHRPYGGAGPMYVQAPAHGSEW